jgi:hypothetical protein
MEALDLSRMEEVFDTAEEMTRDMPGVTQFLQTMESMANIPDVREVISSQPVFQELKKNMESILDGLSVSAHPPQGIHGDSLFWADDANIDMSPDLTPRQAQNEPPVTRLEQLRPEKAPFRPVAPKLLDPPISLPRVGQWGKLALSLQPNSFSGLVNHKELAIPKTFQKSVIITQKELGRILIEKEAQMREKEQEAQTIIVNTVVGNSGNPPVDSTMEYTIDAILYRLVVLAIVCIILCDSERAARFIVCGCKSAWKIVTRGVRVS